MGSGVLPHSKHLQTELTPFPWGDLFQPPPAIIYESRNPHRSGDLRILHGWIPAGEDKHP